MLATRERLKWIRRSGGPSNLRMDQPDGSDVGRVPHDAASESSLTLPPTAGTVPPLLGTLHTLGVQAVHFPTPPTRRVGPTPRRSRHGPQGAAARGDIRPAPNYVRGISADPNDPEDSCKVTRISDMESWNGMTFSTVTPGLMGS